MKTTKIHLGKLNGKDIYAIGSYAEDIRKIMAMQTKQIDELRAMITQLQAPQNKPILASSHIMDFEDENLGFLAEAAATLNNAPIPTKDRKIAQLEALKTYGTKEDLHPKDTVYTSIPPLL